MAREGGRLPAVADDEIRVTTEATGAGRPSPSAQDPRDDWLADSNADELEWFPPAGGGGDVRAPGRIVQRRQPQRPGRGTGPIPAGPPEFLRRRGMLLAVLALVVVVVVIAVVAFGGGGGGGASTPPATTPVTTPGSTTT